jgi:SAM-dependent methyltransferase
MEKISIIDSLEEGACLHEMLASLYESQLALDPDDQYLTEHSSDRNIANHVLTFLWYRSYLPKEGTVLDWGCNHAPDSCLLRATYGQRLQLHGCDFGKSDRYSVFRKFAGLSFKQLDDNIQLPYEPDTFDVVIGSGVLEHTAMDYESLKQLYKILKPEGVLIISSLPYSHSIREWARPVHQRQYSMREAKQLLKRSGFNPVLADYHMFFWENLIAKAGIERWNRWNLLGSRFLYHVLPLHLICDTLRFVARKVQVFS